VAGKFALNDSGLTVSTKDSSFLRQDLLDYLILSLNDEIYDISRGTAQRNLNVQQFRKMAINFPLGEPEQQAIVGKLDAAFAALKSLEGDFDQRVMLVSGLYRSFVDSAFAGLKTEPNHLDQISQNLDFRRVPITKSMRAEGHFPYYGASGIVDHVEGYIFDGDYLLISEDGGNLLARTSPIAFLASGKFWVNNHAHILKCENIIDHKFLELYLNHVDVSEFITGAAQPKLSKRSLNQIPIPFPKSEALRADLVRHLQAFSLEAESLRNNFNTQQQLLGELRNSFLRSAFQGGPVVA
jgi:type I restriction enzyme S subunit